MCGSFDDVKDEEAKASSTEETATDSPQEPEVKTTQIGGEEVEFNPEKVAEGLKGLIDAINAGPTPPQHDDFDLKSLDGSSDYAHAYSHFAAEQAIVALDQGDFIGATEFAAYLLGSINVEANLARLKHDGLKLVEADADDTLLVADEDSYEARKRAEARERDPNLV